MESFDDRRDAYEKKHVHDEKIRFKIDVRANKLLGEWVAERLGLTGGAASQYVESVIHADFEEPGREDVYRKVAADLGEKANEEEIRDLMKKSFDEARNQIQADE